MKWMILFRFHQKLFCCQWDWFVCCSSHCWQENRRQTAGDRCFTLRYSPTHLILAADYLSCVQSEQSEL